MRHLALFFLLATMLSASVRAQDIITKRNYTDIQAKVTEVGPREVKYKRFDSPNGPEYVIPIESVMAIRYENGDVDYFDSTAPGAFVRPGMKFKEYMRLYSTEGFVYEPTTDPYNPVVTGVTSAIIPGIGQFINGTVGRGIGFLAGDIALGSLTIYYISRATASKVAGGNQYQFAQYACLFAWIGETAWAICDAVYVSKVKDLYYRDCKALAGLDIKLSPNVVCLPSVNGIKPIAGLKLAMTF